MTRLSQITMMAGVSALVAAGILFGLTFAGVIGDGSYDGPDPNVTEFAAPTRIVVRAPEATPTALPAPPSNAAIQTLSIPRFDVFAPVVVLGVKDDGVMDTPDGPTEVAWYDFSARPGFPANESGGNAVFSGHVDYYTVGPAVFWNVSNLDRNDIIEVTLTDGTLYRYGVISKQQYNARTAPIETIVGDTLEEEITLITCGGIFDSSIGEYNDRVVVKARRIFDPPDAVASPPR